MTCSINFNRRGKVVEVYYIPDEDMELILAEQQLLESFRRAQKQHEAEKELIKESLTYEAAVERIKKQVKPKTWTPEEIEAEKRLLEEVQE